MSASSSQTWQGRGCCIKFRDCAFAWNWAGSPSLSVVAPNPRTAPRPGAWGRARSPSFGHEMLVQRGQTLLALPTSAQRHGLDHQVRAASSSSVILQMHVRPRVPSEHRIARAQQSPCFLPTQLQARLQRVGQASALALHIATTAARSQRPRLDGAARPMEQMLQRALTHAPSLDDATLFAAAIAPLLACGSLHPSEASSIMAGADAHDFCFLLNSIAKAEGSPW